MNNRIVLTILAILSIGQMLLAQDYLSVAVLLPARNQYQLQSALKAFNKEFPQVKSEPIKENRLHMTLLNLRVEVKDGLSKKLKDLIKERVEGVLKRSVDERLKRFRASLPCATITTFSYKIVATFTLDDACRNLIGALETDVSNDQTIKIWIREGTITRIRSAHEQIIPHISLATIIKSDQGYTHEPTKYVPPFVVHHRGNAITAYWNGSEQHSMAKIPYKIIAGALIGAAVVYMVKKYW